LDGVTEGLCQSKPFPLVISKANIRTMPSSTYLALGALATTAARATIFNCLCTIFPIATIFKNWTKVTHGTKTT